MKNLERWTVIAALVLALFILSYPGRSDGQTNSPGKAVSETAPDTKKKSSEKKGASPEKPAARKSFKSTIKVPVGMPIDFPSDI